MSPRLRLQPEAVGIGMTSQRVRDRLVDRLREAGIVDESTLNAIRVVPRHLFIDEALASRAYEDTALPIGHGQTISQPWVVARMTEAVLQVAPKRVLEVGPGGQSLVQLDRKPDGSIEQRVLAPVTFVPLLSGMLD